MNYMLHNMIIIAIYSLLALSLNLVVGFTGMLSLCHAAFYGIGAYISTLLMMELGFNFLFSLLLAVTGSIIISLIISIPSLRLKGDFFVLASLGFQTIVFVILYNWTALTRGPFGIPGIPRPVILGIKLDSLGRFFIFSSITTIICFILMFYLKTSPFGRVLKAIRDDELAAAALGKNVPMLKVAAFAIAAGFAAIAGFLFSVYIRYIDPTSFTLMESIFILSIIIIGGTGNFAGPLIGTIIMILMPEIIRMMHIPGSIVGNVRQIIYGLMLIIIMRFRPQGILGEYRFK